MGEGGARVLNAASAISARSLSVPRLTRILRLSSSSASIRTSTSRAAGAWIARAGPLDADRRARERVRKARAPRARAGRPPAGRGRGGGARPPAVRAVLVEQREGRRGDLPLRSAEPAGEASHEGRLPRSEVALEVDDVVFRQRPRRAPRRAARSPRRSRVTTGSSSPAGSRSLTRRRPSARASRGEPRARRRRSRGTGARRRRGAAREQSRRGAVKPGAGRPRHRARPSPPARSAPTMPESTSPDPAVPSSGVPVGLATVAAPRFGDQRPRPLEEDDAAGRASRGRRAEPTRSAWTSPAPRPSSRPASPGMRREDGRAPAPRKARGPARERVQRVGVGDERHPGAEHGLERGDGPGPGRQPRPDDGGVEPASARGRALAPRRRRARRPPPADRCVIASGSAAQSASASDAAQKTVTRPAPARRAPRAARSAAPALPREPAMTASRPKSPLCASTRRPREQGADVGLLGPGEASRAVALESRARDSDVGDLHRAAGVGRRRQQVAGLRRPERDRPRRADGVEAPARRRDRRRARTAGPRPAPVSRMR